MSVAVRRGPVAVRKILTRAGVVVALVAALIPGGVAQAARYGDTDQLSATTAVDSAISFSKKAFPDGATQALLGRDDVFADALASGAMQADRPLLLTRKDSLSANTDTELKRLGVRIVQILGGTSAVSKAVEDQLITAGYAVQRISGGSRIETAIALARQASSRATEVILARAFPGGADQSQAFADSLAAGAWAARDNLPIVLSETDKLTAATSAYLSEQRVSKVNIVGGTAAISDATKAQIEALGATVTRVSGPTRFDTAVEIAKARGIANLSSAERVIIVDGQAADAWVSGFAAAALAASTAGSPILLSNGAELPQATEAFLAGASATINLVCGPSTVAAACEAAAVKLGKPRLAEVTLDSTDVPRFSRVKGSVLPVSQVASLLGDGCGLSDELVGVGSDGKFEARITAPEGTCTVTFTIVAPDGKRGTQNFTLDVLEAAAGSTKPELRKAEVVQTGVSEVKIRFIFTEPIDGLAFADNASNPGGPGFVLYEPNTNTLMPGEVSPKPVRDLNNPRAVIVTFTRARYDLATTAGVIDTATIFAVKDIASSGDGQPNAPGSVPLKALTYDAGKMRAGGKANLESVSNLTTSAMPAGKFRATFNFDKDTDSLAGNLHQLVLADGRVIPGEGTPPVSKSRDVTFAVAATRTPEGVLCDGSGCPTVQEAILAVRRGVIAATTTRPLQSVVVTQNGITTRPDLTNVTLDQTEKKADFTFDQDITDVAVGGGAFGLYRVNDGAPLVGTDAVKVDSRTVRVTFAAMNKLVIGAYVADNVVTSTAGANAGRSFGIEQTFAPGEILGPTLVDGSSVLVTVANNGDRTYTVKWRFDREIEPVTSPFTKFRVYRRDGEEPSPTGCTAEAKTVTCSVTIAGTTLPGVLSVNQGAVRAKSSITTQQFPNVEGSIQL